MLDSVLPSTGANKGYAFVNLTTPEAARRLHDHLHGHRWQVNGSGKTCEVDHAAIEVGVGRRPLASGPSHAPPSAWSAYVFVSFRPLGTAGTREAGEALLGFAVRLRQRGISPRLVRAGPRRHPEDLAASRRPHAAPLVMEAPPPPSPRRRRPPYLAFYRFMAWWRIG